MYAIAHGKTPSQSIPHSEIDTCYATINIGYATPPSTQSINRNRPLLSYYYIIIYIMVGQRCILLSFRRPQHWRTNQPQNIHLNQTKHKSFKKIITDTKQNMAEEDTVMQVEGEDVVAATEEAPKEGHHDRLEGSIEDLPCQEWSTPWLARVRKGA